MFCLLLANPSDNQRLFLRYICHRLVGLAAQSRLFQRIADHMTFNDLDTSGEMTCEVHAESCVLKVMLFSRPAALTDSHEILNAKSAL